MFFLLSRCSFSSSKWLISSIIFTILSGSSSLEASSHNWNNRSRFATSMSNLWDVQGFLSGRVIWRWILVQCAVRSGTPKCAKIPQSVVDAFWPGISLTDGQENRNPRIVSLGHHVCLDGAWRVDVLQEVATVFQRDFSLSGLTPLCRSWIPEIGATVLAINSAGSTSSPEFARRVPVFGGLFVGLFVLTGGVFCDRLGSRKPTEPYPSRAQAPSNFSP